LVDAVCCMVRCHSGCDRVVRRTVFGVRLYDGRRWFTGTSGTQDCSLGTTAQRQTQRQNRNLLAYCLTAKVLINCLMLRDPFRSTLTSSRSPRAGRPVTVDYWSDFRLRQDRDALFIVPENDLRLLFDRAYNWLLLALLVDWARFNDPQTHYRSHRGRWRSWTCRIAAPYKSRVD